uniref:helix-turn-helix domain-containing protein n=1 Tax=Flavobacterium sp. TaxID=239 RepID=UPI0037C0EA6C
MNKVNNKTKKYFTQIPNDLIRNSNISDRARFLYCYMSSMSENWEFYQGKMAKDLGYSKDTLRKYIDELLSTGYLKRTQRRGEKGTFDSFDYEIDFMPNKEFTVSEKTRNGENPTREKSSLKNKNFKEEKLINNNNLKESSKNSKEFCQNEEIEIIENCKKKINPFQAVSDVEKERKIVATQKERKPNPNYEAFTIFCQTFEQLSGAKYPTDQNGNYIMMPKDAGNMVYLMRFIDKIDRNGNSHEALKIFMQ